MRARRPHAPVRVAQTPPDNGGTPPSGSDTPPPAPPPDNGGTPPPPPPPPPADNGQTTAPPPPPPPPADQTPPATPATPPAGQTPPATGDQTGTSDADLAKMAAQEESDANTKGNEVITVTGSLIERKELTTPSPIAVINKERLAATGLTNVGQALQQIPAQGNAINAQNNNGGDGSVRINLRSLGENRTLVLLNGRRLMPSGLGADDSVDLSTIPLAMIDRIEVLKDGASATYGSDAIAGVVNIITREDFNGTEADAYAATSQHGDGTNYDLSFVTGHSNKKGNITFSAGWQRQDQVLASDRGKWANEYDAWDFDPDPDTGKQTGPVFTGSSATPGGRLDTKGLGITIPGCSGRYCTYDTKTNGWRDFLFPGDDPTKPFGDLYNFQPLNYVFTPSQRVDVFSTGHYDITDNVKAFFEASYNQRTSEQQLASEPLFASLYGTPISADSLYNPFGVDIVNYNRRLTEFGPRIHDQQVDAKRVVVGVNGQLPDEAGPLKNWKWELSFNYGRTDGVEQDRGDLILSHLQQALGPSMLDPMTGAPICVGTPGDSTTAIPGCVPLSILVPNTASRDAINYLTFTSTNAGFNEQRTAVAQAAGKIMDLPNHGDISLAFGGDYRHEQGAYISDPLTATGDTTGNAVAPTSGAFHLFEGYGELSVVPVSGLKAAQWVEFDAAARAYSYNTFGSGATYKLAGLWKTVGGLSVRGTYGTAFRAPSVSELYLGQADSFPNVEDPCDISPPSAMGATVPQPAECAKEGVPSTYNPGTNQQRGKIGGNKNLKPESATTGTAGIVWEPLKGLALTIDYWNINITNTIGQLPFQVILSNCYNFGKCTDAGGHPLIIRNGNHDISYIMDTLNNIGTTDTSGTDFGVQYAFKHPTAGLFQAALEGTWLSKYNVDDGLLTTDPKTGKEVHQVLHGRNYYDLGVLPDLRFNILGSWVHPSGFGAGFNYRYINSFMECDNDDCNTASNRDPQPFTLSNGKTIQVTRSRTIDASMTADLYVDYTFKTEGGTTRISAGVNNVADAPPPFIYNDLAFNADESAYDFMGRYFYVRLGELF